MNDFNPIALFFDGVLSFIASFCAVNYLFGIFEKEPATLMIASLACAVALSASWLIFLSKKQKRKGKNYEKYKQFFIYKSQEDNLSFTYNALRSRYDCALSDGAILTEKRKVIVRLTLSGLSCQDAVDLALSATAPTLVITTSCQEGAYYHAKRVNDLLKIITFDDFAEWLDALDKLPLVEEKPCLKERLVRFGKQFCRPENARPLFTSALTVLLFSSFTRFRAYYLAVATVLLLLFAIIKLRAIFSRNKQA